MSRSDNSLVKIAALALRIGRGCMASYAHPKSPQKFTQAQLLACLVLKANLKLTYRGVCDLLEVAPPLRETLGMTRAPHYTTLQKFAGSRGVLEVLDAVLHAAVRELNGPGKVEVDDVAIDSTGMESGCASAHYLSRSGKTRSRWIRVSVVALCGLVLPAAMHVDWGPGNDAAPALALLQKASKIVHPRRVWGDAAYDSERLHAFCHERWNARSYAPPIQRRGSTVVRGRYRSRMKRRPSDYGRRWSVESLFSAIKRVCGSALTSRGERTLQVEAALRVAAYAIRR